MRTAELEVFRRRLSGFDFQPLLHAVRRTGSRPRRPTSRPRPSCSRSSATCPGSRSCSSGSGVEEESPGVAASALEFALEGLHLSRRLNKDAGAGVAIYEGPSTES